MELVIGKQQGVTVYALLFFLEDSAIRAICDLAIRHDYEQLSQGTWEELKDKEEYTQDDVNLVLGHLEGFNFDSGLEIEWVSIEPLDTAEAEDVKENLEDDSENDDW